MKPTQKWNKMPEIFCWRREKTIYSRPPILWEFGGGNLSQWAQKETLSDYDLNSNWIKITFIILRLRLLIRRGVLIICDYFIFQQSEYLGKVPRSPTKFLIVAEAQPSISPWPHWAIFPVLQMPIYIPLVNWRETK